MRTGMFTGEGIREYHAVDAFSASKLAVFRRLPADYFAFYIAKTATPKPPTAALDVGNAIDCLLLEGVDEYAKRVYVLPETYSPNRKEDKALVAAKMEQGMTVLTQKEAALVEEMAQAVFRHKDAAALLEHGQPATTFRHDYGFAHGQCRPDWLNLDGAILPSTGKPTGPYWIELKSAASLHKTDYYGFRDAYVDKGYFAQLPLYREIIYDVLCAAGKRDQLPRPLFLVVDKGTIPYAQVFDPLATDRGRYHFELARRMVIRDVERLAKCYETGIWPGLPDGIIPLELPQWQEKNIEKDLGDEEP